MAASFVSGGEVRCEAPRSSLSNLVVHARHDGATWSATTTPTSPYISPTSPHISPHLPTSRRSAEGLHLLVYNSSRPSLIRRVFPDAVALGEQANLSIVGANFFPAARPKCRFAGYTAADAARFTAATSAASLAHDGTMRCLAPAARSAVTVGLTLSFDGGAHFGASAVPLTIFDPLAPAHVFSVTPPYAEAHTPVRVTLHGSNLTLNPEP